ncbi:MAG: hypothetical protein WB767_18390, partial [Nocardioides sp.]
LAASDDGPGADLVRQLHALEYWDLVVDAADSLVFRLMFNSLRAAYEPAIEALGPLLADEVAQVGGYRLVTAAIAESDPDSARVAAERLLRVGTSHLTAALRTLEEES